MVRLSILSISEILTQVFLQTSPGRFFAVNEVKIFFAYILLNYDFKLPGDSTEVPKGVPGGRPIRPSGWPGPSDTPHSLPKDLTPVHMPLKLERSLGEIVL